MLIGPGLIDIALLCPAVAVCVAHHPGLWTLIRVLEVVSRHTRVIRRGEYGIALPLRRPPVHASLGRTDVGHTRLSSHIIMIPAGEPRLLLRSDRPCGAFYILKSWG